MIWRWLRRRSLKIKLADQVIDLLVKSPQGWRFDQYDARFGPLEVWIANRPYADLSIEGVRIGTPYQRRKIRRLIDDLRFQSIVGQIEDIRDQVSKRELDEALARLARL